MITRSKMSEVADLKKAIAEVKADLANKVTNEKIDELIQTIKAKDDKIAELECRVNELEDRVMQLETTNSLFERKIDDNESYTRRQNLRIVGIPEPVDGGFENGEACLVKVREEIAKLDISLNSASIDRAHRVGAPKKDGQLINRPMIVRFVSWHARTLVYKNRPKPDGKKREGVRYYTDLTKRRFLLKMKAIDRVKGNPLVKFAFADVNNNICLMLTTGKIKMFNSEHELESLLLKI